jgi:GTPase SAR1 family protein
LEGGGSLHLKIEPKKAADLVDPRPLDLKSVYSPGLIEGWQEIPFLAASLDRHLHILSYKKRIQALWVVVLGGTGTGKSTMFNALCGKLLSETGVERPKTSGPILYAHENCRIEEGMPFPGMEVSKPVSGEEHTPTAGLSGHLFVIEHDREDFSHLILVDTPDLDSVELINREVAEDLYKLADAVIFVTSQEKYADEVPYLFLLRILRGQGLCYFILNKAEDLSTKEDVLSTLQRAKVSLAHDHIWLLPYTLNPPSRALANQPAFRDFQTRFLNELSKTRIPDLRSRVFSRRKSLLRQDFDRLMTLSSKEEEASREWLENLRRMERTSSAEFLTEQKESFSSKSQEALKGEIRRLFSRYDVLAKPRRIVREAFFTPLRLIGIMGKGDERKHKEELRRVRQRMDLVPIQAAVEKFNHLVLEKLSPRDEDSPLFKKLREPGTALTAEEIENLVWKAQDQLEDWLEKKFKSLSENLPRTRRWGIHTTSIVWGILIVAFEFAVGGGFSIIDAVLDSALAPFVTKGTVELFAYHEIQRITRSLAERYQEELLSVMHAQRLRYEHCLRSLMMADEAKEALQELGRNVAQIAVGYER